MNNEELIKSVVMEMMGVIDEKSIEKLTKVLRIKLHGFCVKKECTEISNQSIEDLNTVFLKKFKVEMYLQNLSEKTIYQYVNHTAKFLDEVDKPFTEVTKDDVIYYLSLLSCSGISNNTLDNTRKFIKSFYNWLHSNDYIAKNPFQYMKVTKRDTVKKEILDDNEVEMMRDACKNIKETAIFDFLMSTGLRVSEFTGLKMRNVNFISGKIDVYAEKTKEYRDGFLDPKALKHLIDYRNSIGCNSDYLFCTKRRQKISNSTIENTLHRISIRAGITKNVTVHTLRKTFASRLSRKGCKPAIIAKLLGHSSIDTTMKYYILINDDEIKSEHERCIN